MEEVDYTVDVLQAQRFTYGTSPTEAEADLRDDARWLANRNRTCSENLPDGSIAQLTYADCLLTAGKAWGDRFDWEEAATETERMIESAIARGR